MYFLKRTHQIILLNIIFGYTKNLQKPKQSPKLGFENLKQQTHMLTQNLDKLIMKINCREDGDTWYTGSVEGLTRTLSSSACCHTHSSVEITAFTSSSPVTTVASQYWHSLAYLSFSTKAITTLINTKLPSPAGILSTQHSSTLLVSVV